jgi:hypothetical protein
MTQNATLSYTYDTQSRILLLHKRLECLVALEFADLLLPTLTIVA